MLGLVVRETGLALTDCVETSLTLIGRLEAGSPPIGCSADYFGADWLLRSKPVCADWLLGLKLVWR